MRVDEKIQLLGSLVRIGFLSETMTTHAGFSEYSVRLAPSLSRHGGLPRWTHQGPGSPVDALGSGLSLGVREILSSTIVSQNIVAADREVPLDRAEPLTQDPQIVTNDNSK